MMTLLFFRKVFLTRLRINALSLIACSTRSCLSWYPIRSIIQDTKMVGIDRVSGKVSFAYGK